MTKTSMQKLTRIVAPITVAILVCVALAPSAAALTATIAYADGAGEGFNDPTLGADRKQAFEYAVGQWSARLSGDVPVVIKAQFDSLGGDANSAVLGFAGPVTVNTDFVGALQINTWYVSALANQLSGQDLTPAEVDIEATFNSDLDTGNILGGIKFYYGTDGNPPNDDVDFVTVVLHEMGHGLGFLDLIEPATGGWLDNIPDIFGRQLEHEGVGDFDTLTDAQRLTALTSDQVFWNGQNVVDVSGDPVKMYAPNPYEPGSSIAHWDVSNFPDLLMEPIDTGPKSGIDLTRQAFLDIGWDFQDDGTNDVVALKFSTIDLAPDDIAALSFLYPRRAENLFFNIRQEARTRARTGFPSSPVAGAMITAWCDVDNDPATPRVPTFSTLSSLYEIQPATRGRFDVLGMFKQFESSATGLFDATYTITASRLVFPSDLELLGFSDPKVFDSTHGGFNGTPGRVGFEFPSQYPSEVFKETGNILSATRFEEGTPLKYDRIRRQLVSVDTDRTLSTILPNTKPMFGDAATTIPLCPFAVASVGLSSSKGLDLLRSVRDNYLLNTAAGTAVVDIYYHVGPRVAGYLTTHASARRVAHSAAWLFEWLIKESWLVAAALIVFAGVAGRRLRYLRRHVVQRSVLLLLALSACVLFGGTAAAQLKWMSGEQLVAAADDIVTGEVVAVDSHWNDKRQIVTDVTVKVDDVIKGRTNKDGTVTFQIPGGRVGPIVTTVSFLPTFRAEEHVILFFEKARKNANAAGPLIAGGTRGKLEIREDPNTKVQYVAGGTAETQLLVNEAAKSVSGGTPKHTSPGVSNKDGSVPETRIPLSDYVKYLRGIVKAQGSK